MIDDLVWSDYFDNDREAGGEYEEPGSEHDGLNEDGTVQAWPREEEYKCSCGRGEGCDCEGMEEKYDPEDERQ